jgi:dipeptide/tripeptide permease
MALRGVYKAVAISAVLLFAGIVVINIETIVDDSETNVDGEGTY